ncbi:Hypothetical predicted protein [Lecanosticta acicola]|uniref:Ca3427-like PBP 2 domain-containing protein n=1 Tax=Lecanosticta acicola TaxID=111012 RepID=A0AAI9EC29_9PEZI|nr:Hypothetical predicted protein [Lecanosticta acicola]
MTTRAIVLGPCKSTKIFSRSISRSGRAGGFRTFSTTPSRAMAMAGKLRIGFVPEHFSTPLAFAQRHFNLNADLIPFPTGTGALASALKQPSADDGSIDVAIGLTEGFVADLGKAKASGTPSSYGLVGTYVESPLCWAISTGAQRSDITSVSSLKGSKVGVSRIGSGSYVMSFVLADQQGWLASKEPFSVAPIGDFAALRKSVNEQTSDFFMWEHFTTKHFWDNGEIKRIGEIYTPWPSWVITARDAKDGRVEEMLGKINAGVRHYRENREEAVEYITSTMHYSKEDALEWMKTVRFAEDVKGVKASMVDHTIGILRKAGVLDESAGGSEHMIHIQKEEEQNIGNPADV